MLVQDQLLKLGKKQTIFEILLILVQAMSSPEKSRSKIKIKCYYIRISLQKFTIV